MEDYNTDNIVDSRMGGWVKELYQRQMFCALKLYITWLTSFSAKMKWILCIFTFVIQIQTYTFFIYFVQNPHLCADPSPGRYAAFGVHYAIAQPPLPLVRIHIQAPAHLLQPGYTQGPQEHYR